MNNPFFTLFEISLLHNLYIDSNDRALIGRVYGTF